MQPKPVVCTCSKRFNTNGAMLQHQRDSSHHVDVSEALEQSEHLEQPEHGRSLQDREADYGVRRAD